MSGTGTLWVVATPIGNLGDLAPRAVEVLKSVDLIACEDTRSSQTLLARYGVATRTTALHEHNERDASTGLVARLAAGEDIALISDAGTPLVSDPGYRLVAAAAAAGVRVATVPGPCALVAALSIAGLPSDRFVFEGFLSSKSAARRARLRELAAEPRTLVFYEAKHRIVEMLEDVAAELGDARPVAIARELTKLHETVLRGPVREVVARVAGDREQQLGEFVVVVGGLPEDAADAARLHEGERVLKLLAREMAPSRAAKIAAEITGASRNELYRLIEAKDDDA